MGDGMCAEAEVLNPKTHSHRGHPVKVGRFYTIWAGGWMFLQSEDFAQFDVVIALKKLRDDDRVKLRADMKSGADLFLYELEDFDGVPKNWSEFLRLVITFLRQAKKILVFCGAGQGRTGTLLASLVAVLEPDVEDPIRTVRERYCPHAVETRAQAEAVFALQGRPLPDYYGNGPMIPPGIWDGQKFSVTREGEEQ